MLPPGNLFVVRCYKSRYRCHNQHDNHNPRNNHNIPTFIPRNDNELPTLARYYGPKPVAHHLCCHPLSSLR